MLPLAGPDQFSDEENDQLPLDLQYLPDDKEREADPDIRKMLVETVMKVGRIQCDFPRVLATIHQLDILWPHPLNFLLPYGHF